MVSNEMIVTIGHGAGGRLSRELLENHFLPHLCSPALAELDDAATIGDLALTTDGYVVTPRFFAGGDIGQLAVCGTVNDLAMVGAEPLGLTAGFILEEGLPLDELDRIAQSMAAAAEVAGVAIVAGDTKVVARGACDGVFITTAGVGRLREAFRPAATHVSDGDAVIVSGSIGDHGMAVMASREGLHIRGELRSDVAPLAGLVASLADGGIDVHMLRDPTRGGVAQSLLEIAERASLRIVVDEPALPIRPPVRMACELLGIDPLHVANEGKLVAFVPADQAAAAVELLRADPLGELAAIIGSVQTGRPALELRTELGAHRLVRMPQGELLPRIC